MEICQLVLVTLKRVLLNMRRVLPLLSKIVGEFVCQLPHW